MFSEVNTNGAYFLTAGGHKGDPNGYSIPKGVDLFISVCISLIYKLAHPSS